jgi:hypothetical protein
MEGGRVRGRRGSADGGMADEGGCVRHFTGVRIELPCTWGCEDEGVRREMRCCKAH